MEAILFDLDNTLYPAERELFNLIDVRINRYMHEVAGIALGEVDLLRRRYWIDYGVTLQGLIRHHGVDPEDYLEYVHDVDIGSRIEVDLELRAALRGVTLRKVVFTNGSSGHARRVLTRLGVEDLFERIYDIRIAGYQPKPFAEPYHRVLEHLGVDPRRCVMVEDSLENLRTAKALGMGTILVGPATEADFVDVCVAGAAQVPQVLPLFGP